MELKEVFSQDFQKAMKRVVKGTQKGSVTESSAAVASSDVSAIVGKGVNPGNFYFSVPRNKDKRKKEA